MTAIPLQEIAAAVVRRAERQGYVLPEDVRAELARAGESEDRWKDVLALARPSLCHRDGRYYAAGPASPRGQEVQDQQERIRAAVGRLLEQPRSEPVDAERRGQDRMAFVQPVRVRTEDGRECTLLVRDLSPTGIRLVGTRRLLGQKVRVQLVSPADGRPVELLVGILWTCPLSEDLVENGGRFLDASAD